jgi:hypothetical protein
MAVDPLERRRREPLLDEIATDWDLVAVAHGTSPAGPAAIRRLLDQYARAAWKYLLSATRDEDVAANLLDEFCGAFLRGDFRHADPAHGQLGVFIKRSLACLVLKTRRRESQRQEKRGTQVQLPDLDQFAARDGHVDPYRGTALQALLDQAWATLQQHEEQHARDWHYSVLKLRELYPDDSCEELVQAIAPLLERPLTTNAVRIMLHDARVAFAEAIWRAAKQAIEAKTDEEVRDYLKELGVWSYCSTLLKTEPC